MTDPPTAFVDANVLFSASLGGTVFDTIRELGRRGLVRLVTSEACVREAFDNLRRKRPEALTSLDGVLLDVGSFELPPGTDVGWASKLVGPADGHVLAAARQLGADLLVTGDITHFGSLMERGDIGIRIMTPRDLLIRGPHGAG